MYFQHIGSTRLGTDSGAADLGRVWGGQNPRFSHFFRCFFDVIFQARFGRRKNREKMRKNQTFPLFGVGFAVVPRLLGKGKDRGKNTSDRIARTNCSKECRDWPAVIGQSQLEINLARCWHTFGGRRIEDPQGGHRRPPSLREIVVEIRCWSKRNGQLELPAGTAQL